MSGESDRLKDKRKAEWDVAMKPGKRRTLNQNRPLDTLIQQVERIKARIRAKVERPFQVIKRQFGNPLMMRPVKH
jgi:transposase, IS5 family